MSCDLPCWPGKPGLSPKCVLLAWEAWAVPQMWSAGLGSLGCPPNVVCWPGKLGLSPKCGLHEEAELKFHLISTSPSAHFPVFSLLFLCFILNPIFSALPFSMARSVSHCPTSISLA